MTRRADKMRSPTDEHRDLAACRHSHLAAAYPALGDDPAASRQSHLAAAYAALGAPAAGRHSHLASVYLALGDDPAARRHSHLAAAYPALGAPAAGRHSHLASVYLALGDDVQAAPVRRSVPRVVCALVAGVVLALAVPLAWLSPAPRDQPAATVAGKAAGVEVDDEDGGGPWPTA